MPDHVLRYLHIVVDLAVVYLEDEADKVGQNSCTPGLCLDGLCSFARLRADDRETVWCQEREVCVAESV